MRLIGAMLAALALTWTTLARADAASDFAELRRGALPVRFAFLGFAPDGTAYVRSITCGETGATYCLVQLISAGPTGVVHTTTLLDVHDFYCGDGYEPAQCEPLLHERASFLGRERRALAALPTLTSAAPLPEAARACGSLADGPTTLRVRGGPRDANEHDVVLEIVRASGAARTLVTLSRAETASGRIAAAYLTPDAASVVLVVTMSSRSGEWSDVTQQVVRIDLAHARAIADAP